MADDPSVLSILIDVKARLDELTAARTELGKTREESESLGDLFKTGLGIGGGMAIATKVVEVLKEAVKAAFDMASEIKDASGNLGLSTDAYQTLRILVQETGGDMGALTGALNMQQRTLVDASNNAIGPAAAAYNALGLSVERLRGMTLERQFTAVARSIAEATNKQEAFRAASVILGERNIPRLRTALQELGDEGFDVVKAKADAAIMSPEAVARLTAFVDAGKRAKNIFVASAGETFASVLGFFGQNKPEIPTPPKPSEADIAAAGRLAQQQKDLFLAQLGLQKATQDVGNVTSDVTNTSLEAMSRLDKAYDLQISSLEKIIALRKAMPLDVGKGETADQRTMELLKYTGALWSAQNDARANLGAASNQYGTIRNRRRIEEADLSPSEISRKEAGEVNRADKNPNYISAGDGFAAGAANYVSQLGSQGEQVANALQNTIGATVSGISEGIYGWITGTESFGQAMMNLGATIFKTILDTIIQMGVQWLVQAALIKMGMISIEATGDTLRAGRVVKENAAEASMLPSKTAGAAASGISSWGVALIFGALAVALIMGLAGGFSEGGYTGPGAVNEFAGSVHKGEVVFSQADVARHGGVAALENLRVAGPSRASAVAMPSLNASDSLAAAVAAAGGGADNSLHASLYFDREEAIRTAFNSPAGRRQFIDLLRGTQEEI